MQEQETFTEENDFTKEDNFIKEDSLYNYKNGVLPPKNDVVFQALFTRGKESITKAMIEDILKIKIHKLELDKSKDLLNDNKNNKNGRLDLRAVINDNIECDIEVQLLQHEKMLERFVYYWAKMYSSNLKLGDDYNKLRKTISIIIVDGKIPQFKEIEKAHTKWQLREEKYREFILTDHCEFHIIELSKAIEEYKNNKEDEILQWMMFLDNPEDAEVAKIMEENEDIKEAKEELDKISQDDILWRMALKEDLLRRDFNQAKYDAKQEGWNEGINEGKKQGKKQGIKEGELKSKIEVAKKMLEKGFPIETVMEITGLKKEEINN